jgi:hypothetical protein
MFKVANKLKGYYSDLGQKLKKKKRKKEKKKRN